MPRKNPIRRRGYQQDYKTGISRWVDLPPKTKKPKKPKRPRSSSIGSEFNPRIPYAVLDTHTGSVNVQQFSVRKDAQDEARYLNRRSPGRYKAVIIGTRGVDYDKRGNPNPALPVGKKVPVYAKRLRNGRIELYR